MTIVIDGMNVGRNRGSYDPEYEAFGAKRAAFDAARSRGGGERGGGERSPVLFARAVTCAIEACLRANLTVAAQGVHVVYRPMAFLVEWVRDGGRTGAMKVRS